MRKTALRLIATGVVGVALLFVFIATVAAGPVDASAGGPAAVLDPSFGSGGVTKLPLGEAFASVAFGASTQDGSILASGGTSVQLLSDRGDTGEAFGGVGSLTVPSATAREFVLGGFTLDPQGRLLVVGSSVYPEAENSSPLTEEGVVAFKPAALRILRFLPDGELDPTFGQGGVVETDLGLAPPRGTDGQPLGSQPSVRATGIAVDPRGRIILTGDDVVHLGRSCERGGYAPAVVSAAFVSRLAEDGTADPTFGSGGLVGGRHLNELPLGAEAIEEPVVGPAGTITYRSAAIDPCLRGTSHFGIAQLTQNGQARRAFGKKGAMLGRYRAIAGGSDGSVVALAEVRRYQGERFKAPVTEVGPDGKPDGSFGTDGRTTVMLGAAGVETALNSLAVDGRGRILVGGTLATGKGGAIVLLRLSTAGRQQMDFGPQGRIATRVHGLSGPSALFFDAQGRLVTVDAYRNALEGRSGLVVARYLLRN